MAGCFFFFWTFHLSSFFSFKFTKSIYEEQMLASLMSVIYDRRYMYLLVVCDHFIKMIDIDQKQLPRVFSCFFSPYFLSTEIKCLFGDKTNRVCVQDTAAQYGNLNLNIVLASSRPHPYNIHKETPCWLKH